MKIELINIMLELLWEIYYGVGSIWGNMVEFKFGYFIFLNVFSGKGKFIFFNIIYGIWQDYLGFILFDGCDIW